MKPSTPTASTSPPIIGDAEKIAEALVEFGGDVEAMIHDLCEPCCMCKRQFFVGFKPDRSCFDDGILEETGELVCEDCSPDYAEMTMDCSDSAMRREYGTWGT